MAVIGLDLSLSRTGIAVDDNAIQVYDVPTGKLRDLERLYTIRKAVEDKVFKHDIHLAVVEDYSMGSRGRTFHIGELGGVIKLMLWERNIPILLVSPKQLKKFATGNGNADKEAVSEVVRSEWKVAIKNMDQSDAVVLCMIGKAYDNRLRLRKSYRKSILHDLRSSAK